MLILKEELEKIQQLKYYLKRLYGQTFFDQTTGKLAHPKIEKENPIDFKLIKEGEFK